MKKAFIMLSVFLLTIIVGFSVYSQGTKKVLLAAELIGFEIDENQLNAEGGEVLNTSLKKIGIITYIDSETNQFVALGHSLTNNIVGVEIEAICYGVELKESKYSSKKEVSLKEEAPIGHAYYDSYCGVYGKIDNVKESRYQEVETAARYEIKKGEANILIRLDGENLESYEVEILAVNHIDNNKNIRIKITDERLISQTGGIVQGMSGTPIMQNGKLVGAINSVSATDSTDAYAIFIDKIL